MNMKAAVFNGKHDLSICTLPVPQPADNEVLIQVMACGVCGTDVHIFEGDKGAADCPPGTVLGHEFAGLVVSTGKNVKTIVPGDRVCVDPNDMCGACDYCRGGIGHFCEHMIGIGTTVNGGFAQYCAVKEKQVYKIGANTPYTHAAMSEPVACCLHGIDLCEIVPGSTVAVIGAGMIGLIMLQLAKISGAATLIAIEPVEKKREMAAKLGADVVIDPFAGDLKQALSAAGVGRIGTVIECAGLPATIKQAIDIAGKQSVVMMFGLTKPDDTVEIKPFDIFKKEVVLKASFINPYTQKRAVELICSGKIDVSSMVAQCAPLEKLPEILSSPALRAEGKYIIAPQD